MGVREGGWIRKVVGRSGGRKDGLGGWLGLGGMVGWMGRRMDGWVDRRVEGKVGGWDKMWWLVG